MPSLLFCQYEKDYTPLSKSGKIPAGFIRDAYQFTEKQVEASTVLDKEEARAYYSQMNYLVGEIFHNGQVYIENELTNYLDSVVSRLLNGEPRLREQLRIYLSRYSQSNALCFADGTIFINAGLLATLESEAELAFVIAHEIGHFAEQHNLKDYKRARNIIKNQTSYNRQEDRFLQLRFSRESELDADGWAVQLMAGAGYEPGAAITALEKLKSGGQKDSLNLLKVFEVHDFKVDTAWLRSLALSTARGSIDEETDIALASGRMDDLFETHPDIDKRIEAMKIISANVKVKQTAGNAGSNYARIRKLSRFERVENTFLEQDYLNSVIHALHLLKDYPGNSYLQVAVTRSLYWLSYYKELGENYLKVNSDGKQNPKDVYKLYALVNEMPLKESKKLSFGWAKNNYELNKNSEGNLFYMALCTENYLGKNAARGYYKDYLLTFPQGRYGPFSKTKLE